MRTEASKLRWLRWQLLALCLVASATNLRATEIIVRTTARAGATLRLAVTAGISGSFRWADGTYQSFPSKGGMMEVEQKTDSFVIRSSRDITELYIPASNVVALDCSTSAPVLRRLHCQGNKLQTLDVSLCTALEGLDCSANSLTSLTVASPVLTRLNCASNQLEELVLTRPLALQTLICSDNRLTTLPTDSLTELRTLFCQRNALTSLPLAASSRLTHVVASQNHLQHIQTGRQGLLHDVWIGQNSLDTLDLSTATTLQSLVANNNDLDLIRWNKACSKTFTYLNVCDNRLSMNSLPTYYNKSKDEDLFYAAVLPQRPFRLAEDIIAVGERQDWRDILTYNGWGKLLSATLTLTDKNGEELIEGTDYTNASRRFTFHTARGGVRLTITSDLFPGISFSSEPFDVDDPTGIGRIENGELRMENCAGAMYDISGRKFSDNSQSSMLNSQFSILNSQFPKGVYIRNGRKYLIK